jgi:signal peptidase II
VYSVGLITAGALGNIVDSAIYGLIFSSSYHNGMIAEIVPFGQGYGAFLHGKVVDMLYFPIKYFELPTWLGGGGFLFFSPIFNIADASITTGVLSILLFQRKFFKNELQKEPDSLVILSSTTASEITDVPEGELADADIAPEEKGTNEPLIDDPKPDEAGK